MRPILSLSKLNGAEPKTLWLASPALEDLWMKLCTSYIYTSSRSPKLNYKIPGWLHAYFTSYIESETAGTCKSLGEFLFLLFIQEKCQIINHQLTCSKNNHQCQHWKKNKTSNGVLLCEVHSRDKCPNHNSTTIHNLPTAVNEFLGALLYFDRKRRCWNRGRNHNIPCIVYFSSRSLQLLLNIVFGLGQGGREKSFSQASISNWSQM